MKAITFLLLTLSISECLSMTFENVDSKNKCSNSQNETDAVDSCVNYYYNKELNVDNVFEFDLDVNEIKKIRADYETDVRPFLKTGVSTEDFCLTTPCKLVACARAFDLFLFNTNVHSHLNVTLYSNTRR